MFKNNYVKLPQNNLNETPIKPSHNYIPEYVINTITIMLSISLWIIFLLQFINGKDTIIFGTIISPTWFVILLPILVIIEAVCFFICHFNIVGAIFIALLNISQVALLTLICTAQTNTLMQGNVYTVSQGWGPILTPVNDGLNLTWYTKTKSKTKLCINNTLYYSDDDLRNTKTQYSCLFEVDSPLTKYHQILIPNVTKLDFVFNGELIQYDNTPREEHNFLVTTDEHGNALAQNSAINHGPFDFHISAGDRTFLTLEIEHRIMYSKFHRKPFAQAVGNHDSQMALNMHVGTRNYWYYQNMQGLNFFFLYAFDMGKRIDTALNNSVIDQNFEWLEQEILQHPGPKFIVTHYPVYSTGHYGSNRHFALKMEHFLKKHHNQQIAAVFSGHDHIYSAFKNKQNQYIFVAGIGGGEMDNVNSALTYKERRWNNTELHGALPIVKGFENQCLGYQHHLDSYSFQKTFTNVHVDAEKIVYTARRFDDYGIIAEYTQYLDELK